jgi:hypothetical protein
LRFYGCCRRDFSGFKTSEINSSVVAGYKLPAGGAANGKCLPS